MRIAVTGRSGQIARSLVEKAEATGIKVNTVARPEVDLARPAEVEAALIDLRPGAIDNAAAYTSVDLSKNEPSLAYRISGVGAEASAKLKIFVVQLSTDLRV